MIARRLRAGPALIAMIALLTQACAALPTAVPVSSALTTEGPTPNASASGAPPTEAPSPAASPGLNRSLRMGLITTGANHTCGVRLDGTVACWGTGENAATGSLPEGADRSTPQEVPELSFITSISAGSLHTCVLRSTGEISCWGGNADGQLGNGTDGSSEAVPVRVAGIFDAVAIDGGAEHTCAVLADGTAVCWGENRDGQLADGTTDDRPSPVPVTGLEGAISIAAGVSHTCALRSDGSVSCWGANDDGQLGDGTTDARVGPVTVELVAGAVAVDVGWGHGCALIDDGTVRCWGANHFGQLGTGALSATDPIEELAVEVVGIETAVAISVGGFHACALLEDGQVMCWGQNNAGQLGRGDEPGVGEDGTAFPTPAVALGVEGATAIAASPYAHTCALLADGTAMCWGINDFGELGDGGDIGQSEAREPIPVLEFDIDQPAPVPGEASPAPS